MSGLMLICVKITLCGPLYLKMQLNRPVKFNYNIYGYKETSISGSQHIKTELRLHSRHAQSKKKKKPSKTTADNSPFKDFLAA